MPDIIEKAKTITEIYNIFQPFKTITKKTLHLYVELFKESMDLFVQDLILCQDPNKTYLVAGQSGNGKSSALNMLPLKYPKIKEKYDFIFIQGRKNFEYLARIDVADVLFNIAYSIIEGDEGLSNNFIQALEEMEKKFNNELEVKIKRTDNKEAKAQLSADIGIGKDILGFFKARVDFKTSYSLSDEAVKSATRFFKFKKQELIKIINKIIVDYKEKNNKELIIIIDDLEKRKDVNHLFISTPESNAQLPILNQLKLIKIISTPIHITRVNFLGFGEVKEFGLKVQESDGTEKVDDIELLREVIKKRVENMELFGEGAINKVIQNSGGNMTQIISLINKSALYSINLNFNKISEDEIIKASNDLKKTLSPYIMNQREFLNRIRDKNIIIDKDDLEELERAINNNILFAYFNGETWFELNPVCLDSLEFYNRRAGN